MGEQIEIGDTIEVERLPHPYKMVVNEIHMERLYTKLSIRNHRVIEQESFIAHTYTGVCPCCDSRVEASDQEYKITLVKKEGAS